MKKAVLALLILLLPLLPATIYAASFDCKKAKTKVEKLVCADLRLSNLDDELAVTYRDAMGRAEQTEKATLLKEQSAWLKSRNSCKDKLCIEVMYRTRLALLASAATERPQVQAGATHVSVYGRFWLTYGKGVKVCDAYLERLNRSAYKHHPKCDRSENDEVPGFRDLNRKILGAEELQPFWASIESFIETGNPERWKAADESDRRLGRPLQFGDRENQLRRLRAETFYRRPFGFEEPVDIDNDGVTDPAVIWRSGNCARFGPVDKMFYWDSIPIVLNAAGDGPDVERTRQLFGHPWGGYRLSSGKMAREFRPIGRSMGIFQFDGTYYMDTFIDASEDFNGNRRDAPAPGQPLPAREPEIDKSLAVFLRRGNETKQVCEYWFEDFSEPRRGAIQQ